FGGWQPQGGGWNRMRGQCVAVAQVAKVKTGCVAIRSERDRRLQLQAFQSVSLQAPLRRGSSLERSSRHGAMFLHLREPHAPLLALLPPQQQHLRRYRACPFPHLCKATGSHRSTGSKRVHRRPRAFRQVEGSEGDGWTPRFISFGEAMDGKGPGHTGIRAGRGKLSRAGVSDQFGSSRSAFTGRAEHPLVAGHTSWVPFICAKNLFVEAQAPKLLIYFEPGARNRRPTKSMWASYRSCYPIGCEFLVRITASFV